MLRQEIKLKAELIKKVMKCEKTCTTRKGVKDYRIDLSTTLHNPKNYNNKVDIEIQSIRIMTALEATNDAGIIKAEGYSTRNEFELALRSIYPDIQSSDMVTVVDFRMLI